MAENKVVLTIETEILKLLTTTDFLVGFLQDLNALSFETKRDLKKAQVTAIVSGSQQKVLADKVLSLTEDFSPIRVERANLKADLVETAALYDADEE